MAEDARRVARFIPVAALLLTGLACSATSQEEPRSTRDLQRVQESTASVGDPGAATRGPRSTVAARLRFQPGPLRAYLPTLEERATMRYAEELLRSECMTARGHEYEVHKYIDILGDLRAIEEGRESRLFGIVNRSEAELYGYGEAIRDYLAPAPLASREAEVALWGAGDGDALSSDSHLEWRGELTPDNTTAGCHIVAADQLAGLQHMDAFLNPLAESLEREAYHRAASRPDYIRVQGEWAACMASKGYEIEDPAAPAQSRAFRAAVAESENHPMDRAPGSKASKAEISLATSDIDCKLETDLVRRLSKLVHLEQERLIEKNALLLDEQRDQLTDIVKEATKVTGG